MRLSLTSKIACLVCFLLSHCSSFLRIAPIQTFTNIRTSQLRCASSEVFQSVDGLLAKRVEITALRHHLLEEMQGNPLYYYEISDWSQKSGEYVVGSFTYGSKLWPSNLGIAYKLCSPVNKQLLKNKTIIDMGCGVGLASIVSAVLG